MIYIDDDLQALDLQRALDELGPQRLERVLRFRHESQRRQSAAAFLLLKRALREQFGISETPRLDYDDGGKPRLADHPDVHFNLSHCRVAVACAVDRHPVGIDIETIRPLREPLLRYTMNADEVDAVMADPRPDVAFTRLWTMKEARLKLTGEGLRTDLKTVLTGCSCHFDTTVNLSGGYVCTLCTD